jgi:hypothetical protein
MQLTKEFPKVAERVKKENGTLLPDVFVQDGKPVVTDISASELGKADATGRIPLKVKDQEIMVKHARGVDKTLEAYDLAVFKSNSDISLPNGNTLPAGYQVWRLVSPN